jgi:RNA polymerase sigma-70 factor, ECF subfamily
MYTQVTPEGSPIQYSSLQVAELISACAAGEEAAWLEFIARFETAIRVSILRVARRWGAIPQECVDDLLQDSYLKLCADRFSRLYSFAVDHPQAVESYVRTIAVNVANDCFKANRTLKRGGGETIQLIEFVEPKAPPADQGGVQTITREVLLREIDSCLQICTDGPSKKRDQLIFWLHYRQGMSADAIASIPAIGLSLKGVESVLFRLTRLIRNQMARSSEKVIRSGTRAKGIGAASSY